jgi:hypothetical protein
MTSRQIGASDERSDGARTICASRVSDEFFTFVESTAIVGARVGFAGVSAREV